MFNWLISEKTELFKKFTFALHDLMSHVQNQIYQIN